jgi:hypothetical protein
MPTRLAAIAERLPAALAGLCGGVAFALLVHAPLLPACAWLLIPADAGAGPEAHILAAERRMHAEMLATAISTLAALPVAKRLYRVARARTWIAFVVIPIAIVAADLLLPRVFLYSWF